MRTKWDYKEIGIWKMLYVGMGVTHFPWIPIADETLSTGLAQHTSIETLQKFLVVFRIFLEYFSLTSTQNTATAYN